MGIGYEASCSELGEGALSIPTPTPKPISVVPRTAASEARIVAVLDGNRRVVVDPGGIQWILQLQRSNGVWEPRSYCRTKEALIRCCGGSTPELNALPDRIGDRVEPTTDTQEAAE